MIEMISDACRDVTVSSL